MMKTYAIIRLLRSGLFLFKDLNGHHSLATIVIGILFFILAVASLLTFKKHRRPSYRR